MRYYVRCRRLIGLQACVELGITPDSVTSNGLVFDTSEVNYRMFMSRVRYLVNSKPSRSGERWNIEKWKQILIDYPPSTNAVSQFVTRSIG